MRSERRVNDTRRRGEVEVEMMNTDKGPKPTVGEHGQMHTGANTCRDAFLKECYLLLSREDRRAQDIEPHHLHLGTDTEHQRLV